MDPVAHALRQHAYHRWANLRFLAALTEIGEPPPRCLALLSHLVASDSLWLDRLLGREQAMAVWPDLDLAAARERLAEVAGEWDAYLAQLTEDELAREIEYVNSQGEEWRNRVEDVLSHLVSHGAHHRGQMAAELRASGVDPPYTDFIQAARTGTIPG